MYIFVFLWTPSLRAVASRSSTPLPYGIIFANFMASMMLGSYIFYELAGIVVSHSQLIIWVFAVGAGALFVTVYVKDEYITFYAFCVFEACLGIYFPVMGTLKGMVVEDGQRASVYGILRIPLNMVVVVALSLVGKEERDNLFIFCCFMLVAACGFVGHYIE